MREVAYTNHIGQGQADKGSRGTNIASASDLAAAEKHNNHDYTEEDLEHIQSNINLALKEYNKQFDRNLQEVGWVDLVQTVKEIYREEFDQAVADYNKKQRRKDRRIQDYYEKISEDRKTDLAVEGLLQIGSKDDWEDASLEDKQKTLSIYLDCLKEMQKEFPGLRIAGASFHVNEDSPHLHWIGVCVDERPKQRGLQKVSNKSAVFTTDNMGSILQDKLRERMERKMQEIWPEWKLTPKKSGRNEDLTKNELKNLQLQRASKELEREFNTLLQEVESLKKERSRIRSGANEAKDKLNNIEAAIGEVRGELDDISKELNEKKQKRHELNMQLIKQQKQYKENEEIINEQMQRIDENIALADQWDAALEEIKTEKEYVEQGKFAVTAMQSFTDALNRLIERRNPVRDKKLEEGLKKAFEAFSDAINGIIDKLRKYEVLREFSEEEKISLPIINAKREFEKQVSEADGLRKNRTQQSGQKNHSRSNER